MRWFAVLLMLAMIPAVQAQGAMPSGSVDLEMYLEDLELDAGDGTNLTIVLEFTCPLFAADMVGQYISDLRIYTSNPAVVVVGPLSRVMDGDCARDGQLWAVYDFQVLSESYANGTVIIDVKARVESPNQQLASSPDDVEGSQAVKFSGAAPIAPEAADEKGPEPMEQTVPGPAVPLLAVGLLALVRRRQG